MSKKGLLLLIPLWLAFCGCGLWVHHDCKDAPNNHLGWTDIAGYDSEGYLTHFTSPVGIMELNHRHPLSAVVTAPITTVGLMVSFRVGREIGAQAVICCFALIGTLSCLLLWLVMKKAGASMFSRIATLALWLSFAHVWLLAGVADLFGVSQAIMLGVLLMVLYDIRNAKAWLGASALAGAVTITNLVKPLAAWIVAGDGVRFIRNLRRRTVALALAVIVGGVVVVALVVMGKWVCLDGISIMTGVDITVNEVTRFLPTDFSFTRRLWLVWNAFWCEPMLLRESVIGQGPILHSYKTILPHLLAAAVLALCAWSAIRNFRLPVVRTALAMVAFDVLLHVVIGWGVEEGQIYCGHWFWIIPLLVSMLPPCVSPFVGILALAIAVQNLSVVF